MDESRLAIHSEDLRLIDACKTRSNSKTNETAIFSFPRRNQDQIKFTVFYNTSSALAYILLEKWAHSRKVNRYEFERSLILLNDIFSLPRSLSWYYSIVYNSKWKPRRVIFNVREKAQIIYSFTRKSDNIVCRYKKERRKS